MDNQAISTSDPFILPIQTDFRICGDTIPESPHCVTTFLNDGGFPNSAAYRACATTVENYLVASIEHKRCIREKAQQHQDKMAKAFRTVAQCLKSEYEKSLKTSEESLLTNPCGDGFEHGHPLISHRMIHYDVPNCLQPNHRTKRLRPNRYCVEEVETFLSNEVDWPMQEGNRQLEFLVDLYRGKVEEAFDCIVAGGSNCYKP